MIFSAQAYLAVREAVATANKNSREAKIVTHSEMLLQMIFLEVLEALEASEACLCKKKMTFSQVQVEANLACLVVEADSEVVSRRVYQRPHAMRMGKRLLLRKRLSQNQTVLLK